MIVVLLKLLIIARVIIISIRYYYHDHITAKKVRGVTWSLVFVLGTDV